MGRRYQKDVYVYSSGSFPSSADTTTSFIYDGWNPIQERITDNNTSTSDTRSYVWGLDLSQTLQGAGGVGGLLCTIHKPQGGSATVYYAMADANGNITDYVDDAGAVSAHFEYDAFGKVTDETVASGLDADDFPVRFSSKYQDEETDLNYYGFRYYSAGIGRWLNRDPTGELGGDNLYVCVNNGGVNKYDVLGLYPGLKGHGSLSSPSEAVNLVRELQGHAKVYDNTRGRVGKFFSHRDTARKLREITKGIGHKDNNRFVFTCKYGFIDMGHFFNNAKFVHAGVKRRNVALFANTIERAQERGLQVYFHGKLILNADPTSAWAPEDLSSNFFGRSFGEQLREDRTPGGADVAGALSDFLRNAGAVSWSSVEEVAGSTVKETLEAEATRYASQSELPQFTSLTEGIDYMLDTDAANCLCDGDTPKQGMEY